MEHALPRRTAGIPRTWALCMTSENHGTVGKAGDPFSHAPGKHERVQVVEIVAAGSAPAPGVDLAGLVRFGFCDINDDEFLERPDGAYFLAHEVEARCASAAPVAAQTGQVAVPEGYTVERVGDTIHINRTDGKWEGGGAEITSAAALTFEFLASLAAPSPAKESLEPNQVQTIAERLKNTAGLPAKESK